MIENPVEKFLKGCLTSKEVFALAKANSRNHELEFFFRVTRGAGGFQNGDRLILQAESETVWFEVNGTLFEEDPATFLTRTEGVLFEEIHQGEERGQSN